MMVKQKIISAIKTLAAPDKELIGPFWAGELLADSIELINNDQDYQLNFWSEGLAYQMNSSQLTPQEQTDLLHLLQEILLN